MNGEEVAIINRQSISPKKSAFIKFIPTRLDIENNETLVVGPSNSAKLKLKLKPTEFRLTPGTVGLWHFNEGNGGNLGDSSGNGYDGVIDDGASWVIGKFNNALYFDGNNDKVRVQDNTDLKYTGGDITITLWVNIDPTETTGRIISKPWNGGGEYNYRLQYNSNPNPSVIFRLYGDFLPSGGGSMYSSSPVPIPVGEWAFIAVTIDGSTNTVNVYVNQNNVTGTHSLTSYLPDPAYRGDLNVALCIASLYPYGPGWSGNPTYSFNGNIDELKIMNRVLTQEEIFDDIYN
jgi:hypothetical protein